ncbi:MAG: ATP-binding protein [Cryomorphaceae bacterium]|nr:ATP-binding protein [Cryomorphaceae bacterium]
MKSLFKQIIIEKQEWLKTVHVNQRDLHVENEANYVFTGLRRAGKSYFLYQIIKAMADDNALERVLMINFEDERLLEVTSADLHIIMEAYHELYDLQPIVFLDEIQNIPNWQKFARRLSDEGHRVYITGSNAEMLSSEIASTLGGRFVDKEVLPLSFREYLRFEHIEFGKNAIHGKTRFAIIRAYEQYLKFGGFPELLKFENKRDFLSSVYQKLFYGDLIARYNVSNAHTIKLLVKKIAQSVNNETSVNRIKNLIKSTGVSIGNNTLFDYLTYLESSFLIASISNFHSKFAEKQTNKKYYFLDTGLLGLFIHDQDTKLLENQVYIHLRRKGLQPFFLKRKTEVDFYVPDQNLLFQVCYSLEHSETFQREVSALRQAMKMFDIQTGYIVTFNELRTIQVEEGHIEAIPAWQWMLEG